MVLATQGRVSRTTRAVQPTRILWKKLNRVKADTFRSTVAKRMSVEVKYVALIDADQMWNRLASTVRESAKEALGVVVGTTRAHKGSRESWWFSEDVQSKVALKQARFRELTNFRDRTPQREHRWKKGIKKPKEKQRRISKARERRRRDIDNIIYIKNEAGHSLVREDDIWKRWEEYFSSLFGREGSEQSGELHEEEVRSALRKMGRNKAVGPDQISIEAWRCLGGVGVRWLINLFNATFRGTKMSMEWRLGEVIPIYKNKGGAQICSNYRGIKLLSHTMKLWERVIETRLRRDTKVS
ncbi:uncharacterized protein [Rutidosis leptorrhynchoides]|uniref:uncharacterized protein n=1 Tax=Rutidosis leptorrhynchoides TaxID=125765 RepID=UPI003A998D4A